MTVVRLVLITIHWKVCRNTLLPQLCTPSFAAKTTPAIKLRRVAIPSSAKLAIGMANLSRTAVTKPYRTAIHEKTATKIAKLTLDGFPANASAITFPTRAVITSTRNNCRPLRATSGSCILRVAVMALRGF